MWYLYIIECIRTSKKRYGEMLFYTGITTDIKRRWREHRGQHNSNYMKNNKLRPRRIVYLECLTVKKRKDAERIEKRVKRYPKVKKQVMIFELKLNNPLLVDSIERMCKGGL